MEHAKVFTKKDVAYIFMLLAKAERYNYYPLTKRDKQILELLWLKDWNFEKIASVFGLTRERIRQVYERDKRKLERFIEKAFLEYQNHENLKSENAELRKEIDRLNIVCNALSDNKEDEVEQLKQASSVKLIPISDIDFSIRAHNVFYHMGIKTIGDLMKYSITDLMSRRNCGVRTVNEIKYLLKPYGIIISADKFIVSQNIA